uniref:Uncharacterized protein n=1 Tax=Hyaloperonospora arabidopsidis (strain Emoy2) TaxID=559515 RepID=M4C0W3_HYAAE
MVASRMAKGPNGTRGFAETWNLDPAVTPEVMLEEPVVESSTASVTAVGTTEPSEP